MIGTSNNVMVSTIELQEYVAEDADTFVSVDHQLYQVVSVVAGTDHAKVTLMPQFGTQDWVLEVGSADYSEPLWEVEGQS
jgi:hypothetical protein